MEESIKDNQRYYKEYYEYIRQLQHEEDEKEESAQKILHRLRMNPQSQSEANRNSITFYANEDSQVPRICSKTRPQPRKSILKNTNAINYIHSEIEWNEDKKYLRDPVVNHKVIKARAEHVKKVKEEANKQLSVIGKQNYIIALDSAHTEELADISQGSTDSDKEDSKINGEERVKPVNGNRTLYEFFEPEAAAQRGSLYLFNSLGEKQNTENANKRNKSK